MCVRMWHHWPSWSWQTYFKAKEIKVKKLRFKKVRNNCTLNSRNGHPLFIGYERTCNQCIAVKFCPEEWVLNGMWLQFSMARLAFFIERFRLEAVSPRSGVTLSKKKESNKAQRANVVDGVHVARLSSHFPFSLASICYWIAVTPITDYERSSVLAITLSPPLFLRLLLLINIFC